MRKSYYAIPMLAAGAVAAGLMAGSAGAAPVAPIPTEYPFCELELWCYPDGLQTVMTPRSQRDDVQYGGGAAFGNP